MTWRNVLILSLSQALGLSGGAAVVLLGGIIGSDIAPTASLATLPISIMVVGVALATIPAALLMRRIGRRRGFMVAALVAAVAALLAAYAVSRESFGLFCIATLFIGTNTAFMQQYRFAAVESADVAHAGRAVSFVLLGGIAGGFLGPEVAKQAKDWLNAGTFTGSFVAVAVLFAAVAVLTYFLRDIAPQQAGATGDERPLRRITAQPAYVVAVLGGAVSYGVMSFIMTATPVHLHRIAGYTLEGTTGVIQSHIIAMYLPSLFTGIVVERLGVLRVMMLGVVGLLACVVLAVVSRELIHFWGALVLLGLGWNLLFVGATVLLTRSYRPAERFKAQATNEFAIFGVQALASLSAGTVLFTANWDVLNLMNLPVLLGTLVALLALRQRIAPAPAPL
jgi:MFS family permease